MADYEVPKLNGEGYVEIPGIVRDTMKGSGPFIAKPDFQEAMNFPTDFGKDENDNWELVPDWKNRALEKMDDLRGRYRSLQVYLDICVKCGACTDKCHYFIGTQDPKNMPVARQDLLRKVYRRYFTFAGKYFPKLVGAVDLTEEV
ncbi:MAG: Sulfite reduction-associated complex DsrMKJOP protein DsrK (=HmeD), partial [uncultured Thiotrichaceae bacterium]